VNDWLGIALLMVAFVGTVIALVAPWSDEWALASGAVGIVVLIGLLVWMLRR
jgi:hypothetical protein